MAQSKHMIQEVLIEVNTCSSPEGFNLKDRLDAFMFHQVVPELERYFDSKSEVSSTTDIRLDKIELDIDIAVLDDLGNLKNQMVSQFKKKMEAELQKFNQKSDNTVATIPSRTTTHLEALLYFLKTGLKPWWISTISEILNEKTIRDIVVQKEFHKEFLKLLSNKRIRERLINQLDDNLLSLLLAAPNSPIVREQKEVFIVLRRINGLRHKFWEALMDFQISSDVIVYKEALSECSKMFKNEDDLKALEVFASSLIGSSLKDVTVSPRITSNKIRPIDLSKENFNSEEPISNETFLNTSEGIFITTAGLVLLHPFLQRFFVTARLTDDEGQLIPAKIETAIHLLHYLATKKEQAFENELVLEKFFCGFPLGHSVSRFITLCDEHKQMAEEVLRAAIAHWIALKNTSPDGLRTAFLQREGKLMIENDTTRILVERKTQDILLDKIPWNLHLIKLPWRKNIIYVDW